MSLQQFVQRGDKANVSPHGQPSNVRSQRAVAGKDAKVTRADIARNNLERSHQKRNTEVPKENQVAHPPPNQQSVAQRQGSHGERQQDAWETDVESLDTTMRQESILQVENSQRACDVHSQSEYSEEQEYEYEEEDEEEEDSQSEGRSGVEMNVIHRVPTDQEFIDQYGWGDLPKEDQQIRVKHYRSAYETTEQAPAQGDMWNADNSYPSTTSGRPDGYSQFHTGAPDPYSEVHEERSQRPFSPQHQTVTNPFSPRVASQNTNRDSGSIELVQPMPRTRNIYNAAAVLRQKTPVQPNSAPSGKVHIEDERDQMSQHRQHHHTSKKPHQLPQAEMKQHHSARHHTPHTLPQRGTHHSYQNRPGKLEIEEYTPNSAAGPVPAQIFLPANHASNQEAHARDEVRPTIDYEDEILFSMSYEQLKNEDFDTNPRAEKPLLAEDMMQKPLAERLEHVQKNIDASHFDKFFTGLPTGEWEEAGDWFLDRFSDIIKRTKEARQRKRKLARDFEDEIEKRHAQISKKQQIVESALDGMKSKGQSLIPASRTPRISKSPAPSKAR